MDVRRRQEGAAPRLAELGQILQPEIGWAPLTRREGVRKSQQDLAEFIEWPAEQAQSSCSNIGVIGRVQQIAPKAAQVLSQAPGGTLLVENPSTRAPATSRTIRSANLATSQGG